MENNVVQLKRTEGNFKGFANRSFPLDADGLQDLQINEQLLAVLGNIGGNKYILLGCEKTDATWSSGYIFTATQKCPSGELLYVSEGTSDTIYIVNETINITASGYNYPAAYTKRACAHGIGDEVFNLSEFIKVETNSSLSEKVAQLQQDIVAITPEAVGTMKFWPSINLPTSDWHLCDGSFINKDEYHVLFSLIGYTYGGAGSSFKLPNVKGRFPIAMKDDNETIDAPGKTGGDYTHKLEVHEMPQHSHMMNPRNWYNAGAGAADWNNPVIRIENLRYNVGGVYTHPTGGNQPHNNMPPFITFLFIIKVK